MICSVFSSLAYATLAKFIKEKSLLVDLSSLNKSLIYYLKVGLDE